MEVRTFEMVRIDHSNWLKVTGGDKDLVSRFNSCTHLPVLAALGEIMRLFSVNPLHLLLRVTNNTLKLMGHFCPKLEEWLKAEHLLNRGRHGAFNGNTSK